MIAVVVACNKTLSSSPLYLLLLCETKLIFLVFSLYNTQERNKEEKKIDREMRHNGKNWRICRDLLRGYKNVRYVHERSHSTVTRVNAWTEWGHLRDVVIGDAHGACFIPPQPAMHPQANPEGVSCRYDPATGTITETVGTGEIIVDEMGWPEGKKNVNVVEAANAQLDNLADVLRDRGIRVRRPDPDHGIDWSRGMTSPLFDVPHQYCATCPRDVVTTLGNIVLEAAMSRRDRYFEVYAYRKLIQRLWREDRSVQWKAAPKASLTEEM